MKLYELGQYIITSPDIIRWNYYRPYEEYRQDLFAKKERGDTRKTYRDFIYSTLASIIGGLACSKDYGLFSDPDILRMCKKADELMDEFSETHNPDTFTTLMEMNCEIAGVVEPMECATWGDGGAKALLEKYFDKNKKEFSLFERSLLKLRIADWDEEAAADDLAHSCHVLAKEVRGKYVSDGEVRLSHPYEELVCRVAGDSLSRKAIENARAVLGVPSLAYKWFLHKAECRRKRFEKLASAGMPEIIMANEERMLKEKEAFFKAAETRMRQVKDGTDNNENAESVVKALVEDLVAANKKFERAMAEYKESTAA